MNDTSQTISTLINDIRTCLEESDLDAARFLRTGLFESLRYVPAWLSPEEETLLKSY
ncbi:MAG: hypothetical protein MK082_03235 [Phycisphaerales bacterium]|nr:hypothetical protein [Phycisphaerales bacterium]